MGFDPFCGRPNAAIKINKIETVFTGQFGEAPINSPAHISVVATSRLFSHTPDLHSLQVPFVITP